MDVLIESIYEEMIEEGYSEDDVERAIEFALTEDLNKVSVMHFSEDPISYIKNLLKTPQEKQSDSLSNQLRATSEREKKSTAAGKAFTTQRGVRYTRPTKNTERAEGQPATLKGKPVQWRVSNTGKGSWVDNRSEQGAARDRASAKAKAAADAAAAKNSEVAKPKPTGPLTVGGRTTSGGGESAANARRAASLTGAQKSVNQRYDELRKSDPKAAVAYGKKMASAGASKSSFKNEEVEVIDEFVGGKPGDGYIGHPNLDIKNPLAKKQVKGPTGNKGLAGKLGDRKMRIDAMMKQLNQSFEPDGKLLEGEGTMRYCPACDKDETREECKAGGEYWDENSKPAKEEDSRSMPTKINLVKNKLRAMGLKMSYDMEGNMVEATEDSLKDRRMERGGVDGNNRYKKPVSNTPNTFGKKKPKYDGMSALERVKADIRAKYGKGAIKEDAKMAKQSDEKLAALHKQVSGSDQSLPSNQFMMKRVTKEMNRRKKAT